MTDYKELLKLAKASIPGPLMVDREPTIAEKLRSLGCSNHGCLVQELPHGSAGTNAVCSCYRHRTGFELQQIFLLKNKQLEAAQAKIDMLMLEYCPEEMTDEQRETWAEHQIPEDSDE